MKNAGAVKRVIVVVLAIAALLLTNGLVTNLLFGEPKGAYLFIGKTYASDGVAGQTLRAVRGYSAANITQTGYGSMDPFNNEGTYLCVIVNLRVEGASVVPFEFDQDSLVIDIAGATYRAGGDISKAGLPDSMIDGPIRVSRGQVVETSARVALPTSPVKRSATIRIGGLDSGVSWRYAMPTW